MTLCYQAFARLILYFSALANVHHNTAICASKFFLPENQNIIKFIEETEFDLIIADPIEMLGPLLSWKYDIPLSFNTRWAMYGDAGELLTGESTFDHLVLTH